VADDEDRRLGPGKESTVRAGVSRRRVIESLATGEGIAPEMGALPAAVLGNRLSLELADADVVEVRQHDLRDVASGERDRGRLLRAREPRGDGNVDLEARDLVAQGPRLGLSGLAQTAITGGIRIDDAGDVEERFAVPGEQEDPHRGDVNAICGRIDSPKSGKLIPSEDSEAGRKVKKLRVLLADDHKLMIDAVRVALEADGDFEVVGTTTDATKVVGLVSETSPDVVVLDVRMPLLDGIACLGRIRNRDPNVKVVMLSASEEPTLAAQALENGASAFILKQIDPQDLAGVLRQVVKGTVFQTVGVPASESSSRQASEAGLTAKEQEVLSALARGLSNQQIAQELWLAEQTVKFHLSNIYRKLEVRNRTEAVQHAVRRGFVSNPIFYESELN
jgi:DNA-binding NarL/FixJ family response regulator